MTIIIKHNIKREGCTLSGQILDCQFLDGAERGDGVDYYDDKINLLLTSCGEPELWRDIFFVWGRLTERDLSPISYTYPTGQAAQDMLDFINTFVGKEGTVQSEPKEKRYKIVESTDGKTLDEMAKVMTTAIAKPEMPTRGFLFNAVVKDVLKGIKALLDVEEGK